MTAVLPVVPLIVVGPVALSVQAVATAVPPLTVLLSVNRARLLLAWLIDREGCPLETCGASPGAAASAAALASSNSLPSGARQLRDWPPSGLPCGVLAGGSWPSIRDPTLAIDGPLAAGAAADTPLGLIDRGPAPARLISSNPASPVLNRRISAPPATYRRSRGVCSNVGHRARGWCSGGGGTRHRFSSTGELAGVRRGRSDSWGLVCDISEGLISYPVKRGVG